MIDGIVWFFQQCALAFYNFFWALTHPGSWLDWMNGLDTNEAKISLVKFIYYGGSVEFFFVVLTFLLHEVLVFRVNGKSMFHEGLQP